MKIRPEHCPRPVKSLHSHRRSREPVVVLRDRLQLELFELLEHIRNFSVRSVGAITKAFSLFSAQKFSPQDWNKWSWNEPSLYNTPLHGILIAEAEERELLKQKELYLARHQSKTWVCTPIDSSVDEGYLKYLRITLMEIKMKRTILWYIRLHT